LKESEAGLSRAMILVGMAAGQLERGEGDAAVASLREAVAAAPDFAEAHHELGIALGRTARGSAAAEDALLTAVRLDPARARYRYEWARTLAERGDKEAAVDQLRKAVELEPSLVAAQRDLAALALAAGEWAAAAGALTAALAFAEADAGLHRDLARALEALGRREEAARERETASRLEARATRR
jgi:tetratricopeptide (TPR) repeat protein